MVRIIGVSWKGNMTAVSAMTCLSIWEKTPRFPHCILLVVCVRILIDFIVRRYHVRAFKMAFY